jgi:hypothetical protein
MNLNSKSIFKDFQNSVKLLFDLDYTKLGNIEIKVNGESLENFLRECLDSKIRVTSENLFEDINNIFPSFRLINEYDDLELAFNLLKGLSTNIAIDSNGNTPVQLLCKTGKYNFFIAIFFIIKIQNERQNRLFKFDEEFYIKFTELVNQLKIKKINTELEVDIKSKDMSLILIFGKSYLAGIKEIITKYNEMQSLNDVDYDLLKNKYVWYRYKPTLQSIKFEEDINGNMCFLTIDVALDNPFKISNTMHIQDLLEMTKVQPSIIVNMILGNLFQFGSSGLNAKGFIKV